MSKPWHRDVPARVSEYLSAGGLFNPELMDHEAVRRILIDARDVIEIIARERSALETGLACDHNGKILGHRLTCAINQQKACDCDIGPRPIPACPTCGIMPCQCHKRAAANR